MSYRLLFYSLKWFFINIKYKLILLKKKKLKLFIFDAFGRIGYLSEYAEMVAGWILGIHDYFDCKSSSLFTRIVNIDKSIWLREQLINPFFFIIIKGLIGFNYLLNWNHKSIYILSWIGTAFAFEATVYWFDSNRMFKFYEVLPTVYSFC